MHRRSFFPALFGAPTAAAVAAQSAKPVILPDAFNQDGWSIRWLDYAHTQGACELLCGFWTAMPVGYNPIGGYFGPADCGYYAATGGIHGGFHTGDMMNASTVAYLPQITARTPQEKLAARREFAFGLLLEDLRNKPPCGNPWCRGHGEK